MSLSSIGDSIGKGIVLLGTLAIIFVAFVVFVVTSVADDAIWDGLGQTFTAMGRGDLRLAWDILGLALGIIGAVVFFLWAFSKVRNSM